MQGRTTRTVLGAALLCSLMFTAGLRPAGAHEANQTEKCAAKQFITMNRMQKCVARAQAITMLATGNDCTIGVSVALCVADAITRLAETNFKFAPSCGTNSFTAGDYEDLALAVAQKTIARTRVLVAGTYSCPG